MPVRSVAHLPSQPWQRFGSLAGLGEYLRSQQLPELRVTGVPHAGIWPDVALAQALAQAGDREPVSELRAGIAHPMRCCRTSVICWGRNWGTPRR